MSAHYIQTADIDLKGINWKSIGKENIYYPNVTNKYELQKIAFNGIYNGNNFKIINLSIARKTDELSYLGLFSCIHDKG